MIARDRLRLGLDVLLMALFVYAAFEASSFSRRAQYMPLYVSVAGAILTVALIAADYRRIRKARRSPAKKVRGPEDYEEFETSAEDDTGRLKLAAYNLTWMAGYVGLVALIGLPVASAVFVAAFLRIEARMRPIGIAIGVACLIAGMLLITHFMHLRWPPSLIGW